jgi:predicted O-methyltransferase YrrM
MSSPDFREPQWLRVIECALRFLRSPFVERLQQLKADQAILGSTGTFDAAVLYGLVTLLRPRVVIETGTQVGMSAACILKALSDGDIDGQLYSVEMRPSEQTAMLVPDRLRSRLQLITGDIVELAEGDSLPAECDMFFHDSNHSLSHQLWEFTTFWPRIRSGGILASHDVDLNASFAQFVAGTYVHNARGLTDADQTAHSNWGRIGRIGFVVKP